MSLETVNILGWRRSLSCANISKKLKKKAESFASQSAVAEKKSSDSCGICETQDHVLEERERDEEKMEELSSTTSAVGEPRSALHMCDN